MTSGGAGGGRGGGLGGAGVIGDPSRTSPILAAAAPQFHWFDESWLRSRAPMPGDTGSGVEVLGDGLGGPPAGVQGAVDGCVVAVVDANVETRPDPDRPPGRVEGR